MRLMLVDDDPMSLKALAKSLQMQGYETGEYAEPSQALAAFAQEPKSWDGIIVDLMMPRLNGFEFAERIKDWGPHAPIIMVTAHPIKADQETLRSRGIQYLMQKPVDLSRLLGYLQELLPRGGNGGSAELGTNDPETQNHTVGRS
jgi:DNA-binding response OmpR family regulator